MNSFNVRCLLLGLVVVYGCGGTSNSQNWQITSPANNATIGTGYTAILSIEGTTDAADRVTNGMGVGNLGLGLLFVSGPTNGATGGTFTGSVPIQNVPLGTHTVFVGSPLISFPNTTDMVNYHSVLCAFRSRNG